MKTRIQLAVICFGLAAGAALAGDRAPFPLPPEACETCQECDAHRREGYECSLIDDVKLRGHTLPQGTRVKFDLKGNLLGATLAAEQDIGGVRYMAHRKIHFHDSWNVAHGWVARNQQIHGYPIRKGSMAVFWKDGTPRRLTLSRQHRIQAIECVGEVRFHQNGNLAAAELARETVLHGKRYPKGWVLRLGPAGRLLELPPCDDLRGITEDCG